MRNKLTGELAICGLKAVRRLCEVHPEKIRRLFFRKELAAEFGKTSSYLAERKLIYRVLTDEELERLAKSSHHGGTVAMIDTPRILVADDKAAEKWKSEGALVLVLDRVANSNNVGAIARTMAFFGVKYLLLNAENAPNLISTSAYRVAEGGMEFVEFFAADSLPAYMAKTSRSVRYLGLDHRGRVRLKDIGKFAQEGKAFAIVLGNEEEGLSRDTKENCEHLVRIPGSGAIESLNVAQAACAVLSCIYGEA